MWQKIFQSAHQANLDALSIPSQVSTKSLDQDISEPRSDESHTLSETQLISDWLIRWQQGDYSVEGWRKRRKIDDLDPQNEERAFFRAFCKNAIRDDDGVDWPISHVPPYLDNPVSELSPGQHWHHKNARIELGRQISDVRWHELSRIYSQGMVLVASNSFIWKIDELELDSVFTTGAALAGIHSELKFVKSVLFCGDEPLKRPCQFDNCILLGEANFSDHHTGFKNFPSTNATGLVRFTNCQFDPGESPTQVAESFVVPAGIEFKIAKSAANLKLAIEAELESFILTGPIYLPEFALRVTQVPRVQ